MSNDQQGEKRPVGRPRGPAAPRVTSPRIDELAGYVSQARALEIMGITSVAYLRELRERGDVTGGWWDDRTFMYEKRSVERYSRTRKVATRAHA